MITLIQQLDIVSDLIHITDEDENEIYDGIQMGKEYYRMLEKYGDRKVTDLESEVNSGVGKISIEIESED